MEIIKLIARLNTLLLIVLLSACQTGDAHQLSSPTAANPQATNTTAPSNTPTETPPLLLPTKTLLPSASSIPTAAPISERPLDPEGPWLLLTNGDSPGTFYNLDGTGKKQIELPEDLLVSNVWGEFVYITNNGRYLSMSVDLPDDPQLWVFKFPEGELILQVSLLSNKAKTEIENFQPIEIEPYLIVYRTPVLWAIWDTAWSPNGRYLAFTGAVNGPSSDVYIFDTERSKLTKLTNGPNQARIIDWSPDSKTIIHYSAEWQIDYMELIESLWAVDVNGHIQELIEHNELMIDPIIADWIDPTTLVMYYPIFEGNPRNLTILDILTGETEIIDAPRFREEIIYDPPTNQLLINFGNMMGASGNTGIYSYDLDTNNLTTIIEDTRLIGKIGDTSRYVSTDGRLLTSSGEVIGTLPHRAIEFQLPIASPDGKWFIVYTWATETGGVISLLMNSEGEIVQEWESACNNPWSTPVWLEDSSGFYCYPADQILLISEENDWEPILVNTMPEGAVHIIQP